MATPHAQWSYLNMSIFEVCYHCRYVQSVCMYICMCVCVYRFALCRLLRPPGPHAQCFLHAGGPVPLLPWGWPPSLRGTREPWGWPSWGKSPGVAWRAGSGNLGTRRGNQPHSQWVHLLHAPPVMSWYNSRNAHSGWSGWILSSQCSCMIDLYDRSHVV